MPKKPTRTTNQLHLTDLSPTRFEDFCLSLIYPLRPWDEIRHYGRTGGDRGVDIYALESVEDGTTRDWYVQCRRYASASTSVLKKAVDDALASSSQAPKVLLVVIACDVRRSAHEAFVEYATKCGVATPMLWTSSTIEARLYNDRKDLLFAFFGISGVAESRRRETSVTRSISIKHRLYTQLRKQKDIDWTKARTNPPEKFNYSEVILLSIDDTSYPNVDANRKFMSTWFKLELWDFYYNGLEFVASVEYAKVDSERRWKILRYDEKFDETQYQKVKLLRLLRLPYRNIVDFDTIGDEYYQDPHIYCRFAEGGSPFEGTRYVLAETEYPLTMEPDLEIK